MGGEMGGGGWVVTWGGGLGGEWGVLGAWAVSGVGGCETSTAGGMERWWGSGVGWESGMAQRSGPSR